MTAVQIELPFEEELVIMELPVEVVIPEEPIQ